MEAKDKTLLVLWDFSPKCEFAYAHAVNVSKITGNSITLLHIIKNEKEASSVQEQLEAVASKLEKTYFIKPLIKILVGSIFKTISSYASEGNTEMVIMATHGIKGIQKFTGSWALKVIRGSKVPFLVVQDMPASQKLDNIIFPIDFKKENKEKIKWAHYLCNLYKARIHIVHPLVTDRIFRGRIYSNLVFAKKYFDNTDIRFEIKTVGNKVNFAKDTIEYAQQAQGNLILIMTSRTLTFMDYMLGPSEQLIIANSAKIPVMVVNPKPKSLSGGFSATGN
ncbi:MAG TPA: universal stress protein [Bacteroidales bacterium]|nr:universal stress protein [Bacteroidales bacterium]